MYSREYTDVLVVYVGLSYRIVIKRFAGKVTETLWPRLPIYNHTFNRCIQKRNLSVYLLIYLYIFFRRVIMNDF